MSVWEQLSLELPRDCWARTALTHSLHPAFNYNSSLSLADLEELQTTEEIRHVTSQRLQWWIGFGSPHWWHFSHQHAVENIFKLRRHQHLAFNGFAYINEAAPNNFSKPSEKTKELSLFTSYYLAKHPSVQPEWRVDRGGKCPVRNSLSHL